MKRALCAAVLLAATTGVQAFEARTGQWWNPNESGSGYNIDIQNGVLVVTIFSYKTNGDSEWYLAAAPLTNAGRNFSSTLDKYRNGQCISCAYVGRPTQQGNDGVVSIQFVSEMQATLTLPGGRTITIVPYDYGYGGTPNGLLGEWVFAYDISSTWAERFHYTTVGNKTTNGTGVAADLVRNGTCEYQSSGASVGYVLCFDFDATITVTQNIYKWKWGIDTTFSGTWVSPTTGNSYTMKGIRTQTATGVTRAVPDDPRSTDKAREDAYTASLVATQLDPEIAALAEQSAAILRSMKQ